nr:daunorubicin resistance protein DrrA family ABC transporter ATP-binding protein [Planobispora longispora]
MAEAAVAVKGLTKTFGKIEAVKGIDFEVAPGEVFGFLGPNGAGKTTTISMLCTLADPTGGSATVAGHDVVRERDEVRRNIGLVFQDPTLDGYLTAEQNLKFHAELYGVPKALVDDRIEQVMEMVALWDRKGDKVQNFSGGMKRRLEIARGLLHSPGAVPGRAHRRARPADPLRHLGLHQPAPARRGHHDLHDHPLHGRGRVLRPDRDHRPRGDRRDRLPEALKASVGEDRVQIQTADDEAAIAALGERFGLEAAIREGQVTFAVASGEQFVPRLFAELGVPIRSVSVSRPSLDDVFMSYTGSTIRDAEAENSMNAWMRVMARR